MSEKLSPPHAEAQMQELIERINSAQRAAEQHAKDLETFLDEEKMREIQALTREEVGDRLRECARRSKYLREEMQRLGILREALDVSLKALVRRFTEAQEKGHSSDFSEGEVDPSELVVLKQHSAIVSAQHDISKQMRELDREIGACLMVNVGKRVSPAAEA